MKRQREESAFPTDVVVELHRNLVFYGVCLPRDLCQWHTTCRSYFQEWCNHDYFLLLMSMAMEKATNLYKSTFHADYFAGYLCLTAMRRVAILSRHIVTNYAPNFEHSGLFTLSTFFASADCTMEKLLKDVCDPSVTGWEKETPYALSWILCMSSGYLRCRHGWTLFIKRQKGKEKTYLGPETRFSEVLKSDLFRLRLNH
jgi:hypothetical protein